MVIVALGCPRKRWTDFGSAPDATERGAAHGGPGGNRDESEIVKEMYRLASY